ncbi:MAG: hypothetical protein EPN26_15140 [Rhodospirillales bacterium]|nr:MAG: hypothetical protein EPN26_15140 [Rhodospirillales bacterium]
MNFFAKGKSAALAAILALALPYLASAAGTPVAMVTDLKGKGSSAGAPLSLLAQVDSGAKIKLENGASLTLVYLSSGKEFLFKGPAEVTIGPDAASSAGGAQAQTRTLLAAAGGDGLNIKPAGMAQASVVMRAASSKAKEKGLALLSPVDTKVLQARPEFIWKPVGSDVSYRFELLDKAGNSLYRTTAKQTSLSLPATVTLPEGQSLNWEVEAVVGARTYYNSAEFTVLPASERDTVEKLRPAANADFAKRVFFASLLDSQGIYSDATVLWKQLSTERPDDAKLKELASR